MAESASSNDGSSGLKEIGDLITPLEYEHLLAECGAFEGLSDGIKEEDYPPADIVTCGQEPQAAVRSAKFCDLLLPLVQLPTCAMPSTEEYPGPHSFEIQIDSRSAGNKWLFSCEKNKLFITINSVIHLGFKCDSFGAGLFVRALMVFCDTEAFQEPVVRCLHHRIEGHRDNAGIDVTLINYVLHIDHPQAVYEFDENSGRYSVRMMLSCPQPGTDWVMMAFKFMCKNSCPSGMNRRPTEVIFTLEDESGGVLGRRKMKVRICSSPKRDITKEENDSEGKVTIPRPDQQNQRGKKRKQFFQQDFLGEEEFLEATLYAQAKIKRTLKTENRQPTEKEAALLKKYELDLE